MNKTNKSLVLLGVKSIKGFTLPEMIVVISIIALISISALLFFGKYRDKTRYARAKKELVTLDSALAHWLNDYGDYPADVNRGLPNGMEDYLPDGDWPSGPWANSTYDWDSWDISGAATHQVSLRFCNQGDSEAVCAVKIPAIFPTFDKYSAVYYCIDGNCRAHSSKPADHPGLCINCNQDERAVLWGGN